MRWRRQLEIAALAAAAAAAGLAWTWRRKADTARGTLAALAAQIAAAAGRDQTALRQDAKLAPLSPPASAPAAGHPAAAQSWFQRMRNDPGLQIRVLAGDRARFAIQYAPFFASQKLTPDQIRQFLKNLMERTSAQMDLRSTMEEKGLTDNDPAVNQMRLQIYKDFQTAQASLLGTAGLQAYRDFEQKSYAQAMVSNLAGTTAIAGVPLDPGQVQQLINAVAATDPSNPNSPTPWPRFIEQAQAFLTPAQLEVVSTAERTGNGYGGYFQDRLNVLITKYGDEDAAAGKNGSEAP